MNIPVIPLFTPPPDFALVDLFRNTCDLYLQLPPTRQQVGDPEASDASYGYSATPFAAGVLCHYEPTPEFDEPSQQGLTKETNLLTSDKWHFHANQRIEDTMLIVMRGPIGHPYAGNAWVVQGNAFMNASVPGRPSDSCWVYAKLAPKDLIPTG